MFSSPYQISPEPSGVHSSDGMLFPNRLSLFPSDDNFVLAFLTLVSHFGWKRVFIITQDENIFMSASCVAEIVNIIRGHIITPHAHSSCM